MGWTGSVGDGVVIGVAVRDGGYRIVCNGHGCATKVLSDPKSVTKNSSIQREVMGCSYIS